MDFFLLLVLFLLSKRISVLSEVADAAVYYATVLKGGREKCCFLPVLDYLT